MLSLEIPLAPASGAVLCNESDVCNGRRHDVCNGHLPETVGP